MATERGVNAYFRKRVKIERELRNWSQADLSKRLEDKGIGISVTALSKLEAGGREVKIDEAAAIADLLEVSMDSLLGRGAGLEDDVDHALRIVRDTVRKVRPQLEALAHEVDDVCIESGRYTFADSDALDRARQRFIETMREAHNELLLVEQYTDTEGPVGIAEVTPEQRRADRKKKQEELDLIRAGVLNSLTDATPGDGPGLYLTGDSAADGVKKGATK